MMLLDMGRHDESRKVHAAALADVPEDAWAEKWFVAVDLARVLGELENEVGDHAAALEHCQKAGSAVDVKHSARFEATCLGEAYLGLNQPDKALEALDTLREAMESGDTSQFGLAPIQVAAWQFAYARALFAVRHDAVKARAIAQKARAGLDPARRALLDAWLAKLP
jgi:hypothetical protein